jgi:hypothetical protein
MASYRESIVVVPLHSSENRCKQTLKEEFEAAFPFPPDAIQIIRAISTRLTGTRSTISFLHRALSRAVENGDKDLVPLWKVFDDLMSYNETPSASSSGAISIRSKFRSEVTALEAAQATLKRITDGQLARPQNRSRAERILNTLFLYHLAGVQGLTAPQILDTVCDLKPNEDELEAQLGHYGTILEEMRGKLRNQIRFREGRYEFVPKETGQYDDLVYQATDRLKSDRQLFWQYVDRAMVFAEPEAPSPFAEFVPQEDGRLLQVKVTWHGQERSGRVTVADLTQRNARPMEIDTHGNEDDFLVLFARRPMSDKQVERFLKTDGTAADPRLCVWASAEPNEQERATLAAVLAHLLVADDNKDSAYEKDGRREFRRQAKDAYLELQEMYAHGVARTSRTSLNVSFVGGVRGAIETMAQVAMDTCYQSRDIDFGNRKFDTTGAIKLINGLIRRGQSVSEGDQLWSAVENFAEPLRLVRPGVPHRLDPSGSSFYQEIRKRVEERGGVGLDVRTVYNWFTGYDPKDGNESLGLTRRMVDVYLLCLAQQGYIRISDRKGGWIDRATIAGIEFKPEHLRNFHRIELPRALPDWQIFSPYLEVLLGRTEGSLGTKYDKAVADEAIALLWQEHWVRNTDISRIETDLSELFTTLGREKNPFDELLLYWLQFAEEHRPEPFDGEETFQAFCRAVLSVSNVREVADLTSTHFTTFRENHRRLQELKHSFENTRAVLLRAARLARTQTPSTPELKHITRAQSDVLTELEKVTVFVINSDTVNTRLMPRLRHLEDAYVPAYLDALMTLDALQREVGEAKATIEGSQEFHIFSEFEKLSEARRIFEKLGQNLTNLPSPLRRSPENRDAAEREVRASASVKDIIEGQPLTFQRLAKECDTRRGEVAWLAGAAREAILEFAGFLRSPRVLERLQADKNPPKALTDLIEADNDSEVVDALLTMSDQDLKTVAKLITAAVGDKKPKPIRLNSFTPRAEFIWEATDIEGLVDEFREYLKASWEDGCYLKIEKG